MLLGRSGNPGSVQFTQQAPNSSQASPDPIANGIVAEHLFTIFVFHLTYEFMFLCAGFKIYQTAEPPTTCELQAADDVTASLLGRKSGQSSRAGRCSGELDPVSTVVGAQALVSLTAHRVLRIRSSLFHCDSTTCRSARVESVFQVKQKKKEKHKEKRCASGSL